MEGLEVVDTTDLTIDLMKTGVLLQRIHIQHSQTLIGLGTNSLDMEQIGEQILWVVLANMTGKWVCPRKHWVLELVQGLLVV